MDRIQQLELVRDSIGKGKFLHPYNLGIDFDYIPNSYQIQPSYEDEGRLFVDKEDENVYIYHDNSFIYIYTINKQRK